MGRTSTILQRLPATSVEVAALESITVKVAHAHLSLLKQQNLAHKTDRAGHREPGMRGPRPRIWDRNHP